MKAITLYTQDFCVYCLKAKSLLDIKGFNYKEVKIVSEKDKQKLFEISGNQKTLPQIFIDGKHIGGYEELTKCNELKQPESF